ncbi:unnamed protein product [Symbiodinium sp. CCMP2592]|nr:unnamed protein product [Symbiodinium sp. CCMP2592]
MVNRRDSRSPIQLCADVLGHEPEEIWILAPADRPMHLTDRARRVRSMLAVVDKAEHPREQSILIFLDLRGVGMWVQWLCLDSPYFDPMPYLDSLQLEYHPGWSIIVRGGRRTGNGLELEVQRGELLLVELRMSTDITPTASENEGSSDDGSEDDGESENDEDVTDENMDGPGDDNSDQQPDAEPDPDRSRSPRRGDPPTTTPCRHGWDHGRPAKLARIIPLALAAVIPPANFVLTNETLRLPHHPDELQALLRPWPPDWIANTTDKLDIHPRTAEAFADLTHWSDLLSDAGAEPLEAQFYTDGSYMDHTGNNGYGTVVLLLAGAKKSLFGLLGEPILGQPDSAWNFEAPPVLQAEQTAIAAAHLSNFVDMILPGGLNYRHTKAHQGDPWNELAVSVAKAAAKGTFGPIGPPQSSAETFMSMDLSWLAAATPGPVAGGLPLQQGQFLSWDADVSPGPSPLSTAQLVPTVPVWPGKAGEPFKFTVKAATLNVQGMTNKHAYLEAQFQEAGYQIVCLQETKESGGICCSSGFWRLGSDARSHWGTGIWINRRLGLLSRNEYPCFVSEEDLHIVHQSERLLVLSIKIAHFHCVIASGHCPHAGRPTERSQFLKQLHAILKPFAQVQVIILGIDLNGRPPADYESVTGGLSYGTEDAAGQQAVELIEDLGMWLPATFPKYHAGPSATFRHPLGQLHRIDFLCVGGSATYTEVQSKVNYEMDTAGAHDDHYLVQLELAGNCGPTGKACKIWRPRYDRQKMATEDGKATLEAALPPHGIPTWTCTVNTSRIFSMK